MSRRETDLTAEPKLWSKNFVFIAVINLMIFVGAQMTMTGMPLYAATLGANDVVVGFMTTFAATTSLLVRPFTGFILDRFQRSNVLIISVAAISIIITAYAIFPVLSVLLALRLFHGIAGGLASTATATIAADSLPPSRFAEGLGYYALTISVGFAIGPALAISTMESSSVKTMVYIAAVSTVFAFLLSLFQGKKKTSVKEREQKKTKFDISSLFDKRALVPAFLAFLVLLAFGAVTTFIALHGQEKNIDNVWMYFTAYAVITAISRPLTGKFIDKIGLFLPGTFAIFMAAISTAMVAFADNLPLICLSGMLGGIGIGTCMGTFQTMAVATVDSSRRGVATSTFFFGVDAGIGAGAVVAGIISDITSYSTMFIVMAIFPVLALITILILGKAKISQYRIPKE